MLTRFWQAHWHTISLVAITCYGIYLLFSTTLIPGCDFPQHLAQASLWKFMNYNLFHVDEKYYINWFTPYFFGYFFLRMLVEFFEGILALRILLSLNLICLVLANRRLLKVCKASEDFLFLTVPIFFGIAFYWGLLNYLTAIPVALFVISYYIEILKGETKYRPWILFFLSILLFYCHAIALGVVIAMTFCLTLFSSYPIRKKMKLFSPLLSGPVLLLLWIIWTRKHEPAASYPMVWSLGMGRFTSFLHGITFNKDIIKGVGISFFAIMLVVLAGIRRGFRLSHEAKVILGVAIILYIGMPSYAFGTSLIFERLHIFLALSMGLCLSRQVERPVRGLSSSHLCLAVALVLLANVSVMFKTFETESKGFAIITADIPAESIVCNHSEGHRRWSQAVNAPIYDQVGAYVQSVKGGDIDYAFTSHHPELIRYKTWRRHSPFPTHQCDYIFFKHSLSPKASKELENIGFLPATSSGEWYLYRRNTAKVIGRANSR